ncbi:EAL domain-containing protein [Pseudoalteromonas arctica]|uniref:EAL domain-containing protein n=1 Tax=Pseudoalteromonas arctica TaxID=394751 RepID=UPI00026CFEF2|nr:EAL domain-containing protein [Pseudoalteromonas arctica]
MFKLSLSLVLMQILNNTLVNNLTSEYAMQQSKLWFLKQFKGIYFTFIACVLLSFNFLLNDALHQKIHASGQQLVKQVHELNLAPLINNEVLLALAKSEGFMLEAQPSSSHFMHLVSVEREVFSYKTLSLSLYHYPAWVMQSYLFLLLNLIIIGTAGWSFRWWSLLKISRETINTPTVSTKKAKQKQQKTMFIKQVKNCELSSLYGVNPATHHLFLLVSCSCNFDQNIDIQASFNVLVAKTFSELRGRSVNVVDSNYLAITLRGVPVTELDCYVARLHKCVFVLCQNNQKGITRKNIKIGACDYKLGADEIMVNQFARSALTLSQSSLLQHCHRLPLHHSQERALSSEQVIENIEKNKFILFFQPLFELSSGDILQHEVLIRVRHSKHGLLAARYFINQIYSDQDTLILDKAVINQVKRLIQSESSALTVSVNLHPNSWFNDEFWHWLSGQLTQLKFNAKLQFEIREEDFFTQRKKITNALNIIKKNRSQVIIDNVQNSEKITALINHNEVCALKLSYELVRLVHEKNHNQIQIKKIVEAAKLLNLPVYAVGVETQKELFMLEKLGIVGAQGFYFSEPLQEFTKTVFH